MRRITYKKAAAVAMAAALSAALLVGCGSTAASTDSAAASTVADESAAESTAGDAEKTADEGDADEVAAKNCADLIDAIYVQERSADTDAQCEAAKAAWDALTDTQKELVEGENADPDYFGRDTGDAGKDDPRNADDIGENELLVVSFGTSFNGSRAADIKGIEDALQAAYPDWSVRRAFTAQIIINHVQARDGEKIDNMDQALDRAVANGVKNLVVQPTHLMHGAEYDEMCEAVEQYRDKFDSVAIAEPLLGEVGEDAAAINDDKEAVAAAITAEAVKTGVLSDEALFALFEDGTLTADPGEVIARCVAYKAGVVERDEKEQGERKLLNLGHTVGHAIEKCSGYVIPHGHAVAAGLAVIARAAEALGWTEESLAARITACLSKNGLPTGTDYSAEALAEAALSDKKRAGGDITLVVPQKIGHCELRKVPVADLLPIIRAGLEA